MERPESKLLPELVGDFDPLLYDNMAYAQAEFDSIRDRRIWVIKFSGGKDSSLTYVAAVEYLIRRPELGIALTVIRNDTLQEAPALVAHADKLVGYGAALCAEAGVKHEYIVTKPAMDDRFWVMCLGHGYAPFNKKFRPCTTRMKIMPSEAIMKHLLQERGMVGKDMALLLGVRRSESAEREQRYASGGHHEQKADEKNEDKAEQKTEQQPEKKPKKKAGIDACVRGEGECGQLTEKGTAFTKALAKVGIAEAYPILTTHTDKVWDALMYVFGPLGWPVTRLLCEVYVEKNTRHGCNQCPLVKKVKDMERLYTLDGNEYIGPLLTLRADYLRDARRDRNRLHVVHEEGRIIKKGPNKGKLRPGGRQKTGMTLEFRQRWLPRVQAVHNEVFPASGYSVIEPEEVEYIRFLWERERLTGKRGKAGKGMGA